MADVFDAQEFVSYATQPAFLNTRYVDHATIPNWGPGNGWDCSSFTSFVMKKYGVNLPAYSDSQYKMGTPVDRKDLQPGDLVFFHYDSSGNKVTGHVGIYIGGGKIVNAANPSAGTQIQHIDWNHYVGARRYINTTGTAKVPSATTTYQESGVPAGDTASPIDLSGNVIMPQGKDYNGDGVVDKKDETLRRDTISSNLLGADYKFAKKIVESNPEINGLFKEAIAQGWTPERFQAALKGTKWYNEMGSDYARKAWFAKKEGGKDWQDQLITAKDAVQRAASEAGVMLAPDELDAWAEKYIFNGWYDSSQLGRFKDALAQRVDIGYGQARVFSDSLRNLAESNGVKYNDSFYKDAASSVLAGKSVNTDWENHIREDAARKTPLYADKIRAGANLRDLVSPYLARIQQLTGLNARDISMDHPLLQQAIGGLDANGNPKAMNFNEFDNFLRSTPMWENTDDGKNALLNTAATMMKAWGFTK